MIWNIQARQTDTVSSYDERNSSRKPKFVTNDMFW